MSDALSGTGADYFRVRNNGTKSRSASGANPAAAEHPPPPLLPPPVTVGACVTVGVTVGAIVVVGVGVTVEVVVNALRQALAVASPVTTSVHVVPLEEM